MFNYSRRVLAKAPRTQRTQSIYSISLSKYQEIYVYYLILLGNKIMSSNNSLAFFASFAPLREKMAIELLTKEFN